MKTSHLENQTLNVNATMSNTDKQGLHRSSVEEVEISEETMRTISNQPFIYQSHVNPKVQVTLEFSEQSNCEDGEKEVKNIFKNIFLKKIIKGAFQSGEHALECPPHNFTEVNKNG